MALTSIPEPASNGLHYLSFVNAAPHRVEMRPPVVAVRGGRGVDGPVAAGTHAINWDRRDLINARVAAGIYFVRVTAGRFQDTQRIVLVD